MALILALKLSRIEANLRPAGLSNATPAPLPAGRSERAFPARGSLMEGCHRHVREVETRMVANLTPKERRLLAGLLQRCAENLRSRRAQARGGSGRGSDSTVARYLQSYHRR